MRERGIEGASVADVMSEAGMTHGGFYRHFDTKEALLASALQSAFDQIMAELDRRLAEDAPEVAVADFHAFYLSQGHVDQPGIGCPVAAVGAGVNRMVEALAKGMKGSARARRAAALRELATLAGALVIARASDPDTARDMLSACKRGARIA